jgi:hypothetical protein
MSAGITSPEPSVDAGVGDGFDDGVTEGEEAGVGCVVLDLDASSKRPAGGVVGLAVLPVGDVLKTDGFRV